ncbi:MAG: copper-binding protein [Gordonia sp. (in: high G+C Gram-positive bacteria)]|uniref:copper-binding protein n=1 Tax=Gordonia sp. (in: high G+C Gram-positive bacteria) TaxID=84139 RepID=UPI0039E39AE6
MSAFTRTTARRIASATAAGALGVAIALGTTACGAGKISQTNNQAPAVNGAYGTLTLPPVQEGGQSVPTGSIDVRNLQIEFPQDDADQVFGKGGPFKLGFTIVNNSPQRTVKLVSIRPVQGTVALPGVQTIAPNGALTAGLPTLVDPSAAAKDGVDRIDLELTGTGDSVRAGLTVPLNFTFEFYDLAGNQVGQDDITINTPVDGTPLTDRPDTVRDLAPAGEEGGH